MCEHVFVFENLTSNQKGAIAEAEIRAAATRANIALYDPTTGHSRADLIFEIGDKLFRVQVKWGRVSAARDVIIVHVGGCYLGANGYVHSTYSETEMDLLAVYCGELDRCFLLPSSVFCGVGAIQLRLTPARNNQRACINLADEYEFAGAIAQLVEHLDGIEGAVGSSPTSSTDSPSASGPAVTLGSNVLWGDLSGVMDRVRGGEEIIVTRRGKPQFKMTPLT